MESNSITPRARNYFKRKILTWHKTLSPVYPWRITKNPWHALVAEIMLQRTNADQVVPIYSNFCSRFPNTQTFLRHANRTKVNYFSDLGLLWRNQFLIRSAEIINKNGIPKDKKELLALPGVGDYVASALLSLHFDIRSILIDSNIVRVYGRYFGFPYNNETRRRRELWELADALTPQLHIKSFNYAILDFSRNICCSKPRCNVCSVRLRCHFYLSNMVNTERKK